MPTPQRVSSDQRDPRLFAGNEGRVGSVLIRVEHCIRPGIPELIEVVAFDALELREQKTWNGPLAISPT
jgi:hypothetical protein